MFPELLTFRYGNAQNGIVVHYLRVTGFRSEWSRDFLLWMKCCIEKKNDLPFLLLFRYNAHSVYAQ